MRVLYVANLRLPAHDHRRTYSASSNVVRASFASPVVDGADGPDAFEVRVGEGLGWSDPIGLLLLGWQLCRRRRRIDAVHFLSTKLLLAGPVLARVLGIPSVITVTGLGRSFDLEGLKGAALRSGYRCAFGISARFAQLVLFQSRTQLATVSAWRNMPTHKFHYIGSASPLQQERSWCERDPVGVLAVARFGPRKGVEEFLHLARTVPPGVVEFDLAGTSADPSDPVLRMVAEAAADGLIRHHGFVAEDDLIRLYDDNEIFLYASTYGEGIPRALLEAAGAGCCVVGYRTRASLEVLGDDYPFLVPSGDLVALGQALLEAAGDFEARRAAGRLARRRIEEEWSPAAYRRRLDSVMATLTNRDLGEQSPWLTFRQRWLDRPAALAGALLSAPLIGLLALAARAGDGERGLITVRRVGRSAQVFPMWKVRSMRAAAPGSPPLTAVADERITRLGRLIRPAHLDELPQLWNVLRGDMAIVGPRPESPDLVTHDEAWATVLASKPGIIGPSQVVLAEWEAAIIGTTSDVTAYQNKVLPTKLRLDGWYVRHARPVDDLLSVAGVFSQRARTAVIRRSGLSLGTDGDASRTGLRRAHPSDVREIARVHASAFPDAYLTRMGLPFLRSYYTTALASPSCLAVVLEESGEMRGFAVGFSDPGSFYDSLSYADVRLALPVALAVLRHPSLIAPTVRNVLRVGGHTQETSFRQCDAELASIAVHAAAQGGGSGRLLLDHFLRMAVSAGAERVVLTTDEDGNESVHRFYRKAGFVRDQSLTRGARRLGRWSRTLDSDSNPSQPLGGRSW